MLYRDVIVLLNHTWNSVVGVSEKSETTTGNSLHAYLSNHVYTWDIALLVTITHHIPVVISEFNFVNKHQ